MISAGAYRYDLHNWLELFWQWVYMTLVGDRCFCLADNPEVVCCLRKGVQALRGSGPLPDWGRVSCTRSGSAFGAVVPLPGLVGRVGFDVVGCDLRSQFLHASRVAGSQAVFFLALLIRCSGTVARKSCRPCYLLKISTWAKLRACSVYAHTYLDD